MVTRDFLHQKAEWPQKMIFLCHHRKIGAPQEPD
jgi:hypothetical protein